MPGCVEYNGQKIKPRIFDYDTLKDWSEFTRTPAGAIMTCGSWLRHSEGVSDMKAWAKKVDAMYGSIDDETFMSPDEWEKNAQVLS